MPHPFLKDQISMQLKEGYQVWEYSLFYSNRICLLRRQNTAEEKVTITLQVAYRKNFLTPLVWGGESRILLTLNSQLLCPKELAHLRRFLCKEWATVIPQSVSGPPGQQILRCQPPPFKKHFPKVTPGWPLGHDTLDSQSVGIWKRSVEAASTWVFKSQVF